MINIESMDKEEINSLMFALREAYDEKKSFEKLYISDLAEKTGIPIGKIYANFNDKEDIALEVIKKSVYDIFVTFDEEVGIETHLGDKLKIFLSLQLEFFGPYFHLTKELLPGLLLNPFSKISLFLIKTRYKYIDFLSELFQTSLKKSDFIFKTFTLPALTNAFLLFNIAVFQYWENDKSEGKQNTLNFIEKGTKNFMVMSALL